MIKHKYNAKRTELEGIKFASKKESRYYSELKLLQQAGEVLFFLRQVPFHLEANVKYVADFFVFYKDGHAEVVDVKGKKTDMYKLKKKQVETRYSIEIIEV